MRLFIFLFITLALQTFNTIASDTTKVLFIGNSITYFNNMPQTFEDISNALGQNCVMEMYAPGGTGFAHHVENPEIYALFRQADWDYIILQPGTGDSGGEQFGGTPIDQSLIRIRTLLDSAYLYNPCSQVLLYEISNGVYSASEEHLETYNASMDVIHANVKYFSDSTQLAFAPVGEAFRTLWNQNTDLLLWNSFGDIHPNVQGSYLAACVFYSSIFNSSSEGCTVTNGLSNEETAYLQNLATQTVLDDPTGWNFEVFDVKLEFNINYNSEFNASQIQIENLSENFDSLLWNFGDGNFSNEINPSHSYASNGIYNIELKVYRNGCSNSLTDEVEIISLDIQNTDQTSFIKVFPNPAKDFLLVQVPDMREEYSFEILDSKGQLKTKSKSSQLHVSDLPEGMYLLKISHANWVHPKMIRWIKH